MKKDNYFSTRNYLVVRIMNDKHVHKVSIWIDWYFLLYIANMVVGYVLCNWAMIFLRRQAQDYFILQRNITMTHNFESLYFHKINFENTVIEKEE
jgi:hypothetical protein